ncbi:MAG: hypothetical protein ACYC0V_14950 [Armatimonadota bacterium]
MLLISRFVIIMVFASVMQSTLAADKVTVKGVIGDTDISIKADMIPVGGSCTYKVSGIQKYICVKEVYPDSPVQPEYSYNVFAGEYLIFKRFYSSKGFGIVSSFIDSPFEMRKVKSIRIVNDGSVPIRIKSVIAVNSIELEEKEKNDSFGLFGLLDSYHGVDTEAKWIKVLADGLPKAKGIYRGFSSEIPYAAWGDDTLKSMINRHIDYASTYGLSYLPSFVSWWAATPLAISDGKGGKFGDIKYQQICWSPDDNTDEGPEFRALLGDRWNIHYGLSIPNEWSDVPWMTMNNPDYNKYRLNRLDWTLKEFFKRTVNSKADVKGIYLENEPRYWDTICEASNNKRSWKTCWADFNPCVIADAKKDGVDINPSNGLDDKERLWLHRNVARYNQGVVDQARASMKAAGIDKSMPVYPHSLQLLGFPGDEIGHPMSEWAYVKGAYTGLEAIWTKLSDFDRVREWGPWTNLNREENDGRDIAEHLWDLRVSYARGSNLYNSYNWNNIGHERVFAYMKEFLDNLPSVKLKNPENMKIDKNQISFRISPDLQGFNELTVNVSISSRIFDGFEAVVTNSKNQVIGYAQNRDDYNTGKHKLFFPFPNPFELAQGETGIITIKSLDKSTALNIVITDAKLSFDIRLERTLSKYVIQHAKR